MQKDVNVMWLLVTLTLVGLVLGDNFDQLPLSHFNRRTLKLECPSRSVCADVFAMLRRGRRRAIYNCHCPGQEGRCQLDETRMLHETYKHKMYFCEPMQVFPQCSDNDEEQVAEVIVRDSPVFDYNAFVKVKCQCPRHHEPVVPEPGHIERAVTWVGNRLNVLTHVRYQNYACARQRRQYFDRYRPDRDGHSGK